MSISQSLSNSQPTSRALSPSPSEPPCKKVKRFLSTTTIDSKSKSKLHLSDNDWLDEFAPKTVTDLALHPKKIEELEEWLEECSEYENSILLLTGPSGSGKTTSIKMIAKNRGFTVTEWITPMDVDWSDWSNMENENAIFRENQVDKFRDFLFRASRYSSLFENDSNKVIIIEDLPNIFFKENDKFVEILK